MDLVDGPHGAVLDRHPTIGDQSAVVVPGGDLVSDEDPVRSDGCRWPACVEFAMADASVLAAGVESFGCFVGRRHQQSRFPAGTQFPPSGDGLPFHLCHGAAVESSVLFVEVSDGDVAAP